MPIPYQGSSASANTGASDWTFKQLGGKHKTLTLSGYSAPFGRPRQRAIVNDSIKVRQNTVFYPGSDAAPTRHIFGDQYEPWELSGRFMDQEAGGGYARTTAKLVKDFVRDKQQCAIDWGEQLSIRGFIENLELGRESITQIAWKMIVLVDEDSDRETYATPPKPKSPMDMGGMIQRSLFPILKIPDADIKPGFLDAIDNLVSSINTAFANFVSIANSIDSFEKALIGDLKRLRAGINQLRTAAISLQETISNARLDTLTFRRDSESDINLMVMTANAPVYLTRALGELSELDKASEQAERGKVVTYFVATLGDSWESISTRFLGGPESADAIRAVNGVQYGQQPTPGRTYKVPLK